MSIKTIMIAVAGLASLAVPTIADAQNWDRGHRSSYGNADHRRGHNVRQGRNRWERQRDWRHNNRDRHHDRDRHDRRRGSR